LLYGRYISNNLDYDLDSQKFKAYRFMSKLNSRQNVICG
jgi:hypothetical protein